MNKVNRKTKNWIIASLFIVYLVIYRLIFTQKSFFEYTEAINATFSIIILAISIFFLGYRKFINTQYRKSFVLIVVISLFLYFIGTYGAGLLLGFLSNSYSLKPLSMLNNTFFIGASIVSLEVFRYVFISSNKDNKFYIVFITILLMFIDINFVLRNDTFNTIESGFKFLTISILPIIMRGIMCSYLTYYSDFKASLVYKLIIELYIYIVPIQPDLNDFVISIINLVLPFVIIMYCNNYVYEKDEYVEHSFGTKVFRLVDVPFIIILVGFAFVVFGIGPYKMIGIETGSMSPKIKIGDAVVIDKTVDFTKLKEGDIVAYKSERGIIIVHRIINVNSDNTYITKGDFNNSPDGKYVDPSQIVGKVRLKIPFIAYPKIIFK